MQPQHMMLQRNLQLVNRPQTTLSAEKKLPANQDDSSVTDPLLSVSSHCEQSFVVTSDTSSTKLSSSHSSNSAPFESRKFILQRFLIALVTLKLTTPTSTTVTTLTGSLVGLLRSFLVGCYYFLAFTSLLLLILYINQAATQNNKIQQHHHHQQQQQDSNKILSSSRKEQLPIDCLEKETAALIMSSERLRNISSNLLSIYTNDIGNSKQLQHDKQDERMRIRRSTANITRAKYSNYSPETERNNPTNRKDLFVTANRQHSIRPLSNDFNHRLTPNFPQEPSTQERLFMGDARQGNVLEPASYAANSTQSRWIPIIASHVTSRSQNRNNNNNIMDQSPNHNKQAMGKPVETSMSPSTVDVIEATYLPEMGASHHQNNYYKHSHNDFHHNHHRNQPREPPRRGWRKLRFLDHPQVNKMYKLVLICDKTLVSLDYIRNFEIQPQFGENLHHNNMIDFASTNLDYNLATRADNLSLKGEESNDQFETRSYLKDDDPLVKCDMWDLEKSLKNRKPPIDILRMAVKADFDTVRDAINRCRQLTEKTLPSEDEFREGEGLELLSMEDLVSLFSVKRGLMPGTKWCGLGDVASSYNDLGPKHRIDICCRAHDHCPIRLKPFRNDYGVMNIALYTKSHCDCDADFYRCLREARSRQADMLGNLYFNVMKLQCMHEERLKICREMKPIAFGFERCIKYEESPHKTVFKFTSPPIAY